jgi:hypothetical protein
VLYGVVRGYEMAARLKQSGTPVILNLRWPVRDRDADPEDEDSYRELRIRDLAPHFACRPCQKRGVKWDRQLRRAGDSPRALAPARSSSPIDRGTENERMRCGR